MKEKAHTTNTFDKLAYKSKVNCLKDMKALASKMKPTEAELCFGDMLRREKVTYQYQVPVACAFSCGKKKKGKPRKKMYLGWIIDYVIDDNVAIEIDGGYHNKYEQKQKDALKDRMLRESGYTVIRISNEEAKCFSNTGYVPRVKSGLFKDTRVNEYLDSKLLSEHFF